MEKNFVTAITAQNATETTKTLIDTITVPQGVTKLVEFGIQMMGVGLTTLETVSCIAELESDDATNWGGTQQFASDVIEVLTSGAISYKPTVHDCNIPVSPGSHIKVSITYNMALTITPSTRCFGKYV